MPRFAYKAIFFPQEGFEWHNEDAWRVSSRAPIFAVADGVTMPLQDELAAPSPAKKVAELFCRETIRSLEAQYPRITFAAVKNSYEAANEAAGEWNERHKETAGAVGAVAAISGTYAYLSRLTDCGIALIRQGRLAFKTPEFWSSLKRKPKRLRGHGVVSGEAPVARFVETWRVGWREGDTLALFTDGFENHFSVPSFVRLFRERNLNVLAEHIEEADEALADRDTGSFGRERTLLIARLAL